MTGKITFAGAAFTCVLLAGCAAGSDLSGPPVVSSTGAAAAVRNGDDKDVICRQQHRTGSHMAQVVCTTRAEREAAEADSAREFNKMQRSGPTRGCAPNCKF